MVGLVEAVDREPAATSGLSGAHHERITLIRLDGSRERLILKIVVPAESWTAYRSGDAQGREALILSESALNPIWEVVACHYLAYAVEPGQIGLLMHDLSPWLPASDQRLSQEQEEAFLHILAALHARFWQSDALTLPWLAPLSVRFSILGPGAAEEELQRHPGHPLFTAVARGWELALACVPAGVRDLLLLPADQLAARYAHLPATLLHGDAKTGNCAFVPDGRVALFDWATLGPGPSTIDLYYFLAVDVARHAGAKDAIIARYRELLEAGLERRLPEELWQTLHEVGIIAAARMLLWSKALALERGVPGAQADWDWWIARLAPYSLK